MKIKNILNIYVKQLNASKLRNLYKRATQK